MAVTNFIQTIWSKRIQDALELNCKLVDNCTRDYEGDVKYAQSVKILGVGEPTIGAYDGTKDMARLMDNKKIPNQDLADAFCKNINIVYMSCARAKDVLRVVLTENENESFYAKLLIKAYEEE